MRGYWLSALGLVIAVAQVQIQLQARKHGVQLLREPWSFYDWAYLGFLVCFVLSPVLAIFGTGMAFRDKTIKPKYKYLAATFLFFVAVNFFESVLMSFNGSGTPPRQSLIMKTTSTSAPSYCVRPSSPDPRCW